MSASRDHAPTGVVATTPSTPSDPSEPPAPAPPSSPLDRAFLTNLPGVGTLILVRHGQQVWPSGEGATVDEWVDPPLSATGRRQAEAVGQALAASHIDAVYSSHLERAQRTGQEIGRHHGLEPVVMEELREIEMFRDLPAGSTLRDLIHPQMLLGMQARFVRERTWDVYPYTETSAEFHHRIVTAIEGILATHPGQTVVVACHGGVINAYLGHQLGMAEDMFFRPAHASVHRVLAADGRRVLQSLNETHHLAAIDPALVTC